MAKIEFTKAVASGNDFVIIEGSRHPSLVLRQELVKKICDRKFGVGSDGVLLLEESKKADIRMRIFNADGSEAQMCGNGARCVAFYSRSTLQAPGSTLKIETKAGILSARVVKDKVKIKLTDPKEYQKKIPLVIRGRKVRTHFINTGVPHAIVFVQGIEHIDVRGIAREIRYHTYFSPAGTNVNFVEALNNDTIKVRTYERGVEDETLACGTGAAASAIVCSLQSAARNLKNKMNIITQGGETLKVYFDRKNDTITGVWLEGKVKIVYLGEYYA